MTPVQRNTLDYLVSYCAEHRRPPSYAEIGKHIGTSAGNVHRIVHALVEQGCIKITPKRKRSIEIIDARTRDMSVDFLPHHLAVWVRTMAGKCDVKPIDIVTEAVRDAYTALRKPEQKVPRETFAPLRASA